MVRILAISVMLVGVANAAGQVVERAYCGADGEAHVVFADHSRETIPPQKDQINCADMAIADDHHTFGWSMQVENCCTSYPISIAVIAMRNKKATVLRSNQMIWQWHFVDHGNQIAVLSGPVHGNATEAVLYNVHTGKRLAAWPGTGNAPEWAGGWKDQFALGSN